MQTLKEIKQLLEAQGLRPNKALGQSFLIDQNLLRKLVDASGASDGDLVLEVGPGTGTLTEELLDRGCEVIACELDAGMARLLRDRFDGNERFVLIEGDCLANKGALSAELCEAIAGRAFTLVANLPYGAASPLMVILATTYTPKDGTGCLGQFVTIQKEVGQRLRAVPGTKDFGELGVVVQAMCEVRRIVSAAPTCFWPQPKVTSEMVSIVPRERPLTIDAQRLAQTCRLLFTKRRKKLSTILRGAGFVGVLPDGIDSDVRPEHLSVEQLERLSCAVTAASQHNSP